MATTQKGIYYNDDYTAAADVLEDERLMAESVDEAIGDSEASAEEQYVKKVAGKGLSTNDFTDQYKNQVDTNATNIQTNATNIAQNTQEINAIKSEQTTQNTNIQANADNITALAGRVTEAEGDISDIQEKQAEQNISIEALQEEVEDLTERVEDAENNEITNTPEKATSHYLQDSADSRFRKFIPIGRSVQDGDPTPENPVPIKNTGDNVNEFDKNQVLQNYELRGANAGDEKGQIQPATGWYVSDFIEVKQNTTYYLSGNKTSGSANALYDENKNCISIITAIKGAITTIANTKYIRFNGKLNELDNNIKFEEDNKATPYSPYGCGNVNEKVENKNLLPFNNQDFTLNSVRYYVQNGSLYFNGTSTSETSSNNTNFKNNFNFTLEAGTYKISHKTGVNVVYLYNYDNDSTSLVTLGTDTANQTFTLTKKTRLYIGFYVYQKTFNNINTEIMIEQGSTATDYVPHSEQNPSFPLAQGQKFYEGSHPDDDEKVHHKMGEYQMTGNENFECKNITDENIHFSSNAIETFIKAEDQAPLCTHFTYSGSLWSTDKEGIYIAKEYYHIRFRINKSYLSDISTKGKAIDSFKTYLREQYANGTPVIVVFKLAEEQTEDFTEEQQTAWEQIKKARTYKNVTHISSEDETPANVDITYVRDLETVINELSSAIVAQGGV